MYKEPVKRPVEEAVADILNSSLSIDVPHPPVSIDSGEEYEVIGGHGLSVVLPPRPTCSRGIIEISVCNIIFGNVHVNEYDCFRLAIVARTVE